MKLGTLGFIAALAVTGSIAVSAAWSHQPPAPSKAPPAAAAPAAKKQENLQHVLEMFRSDLNAAKVRTLNQVMKLTSEEAEKFWPIYQRYEKELTAVDDRRVAMIREFVKLSNDGGLNNDNAAQLADKWLKVQQDRLDLWKKYNTEIAKALSPIRGGQFLQVEHQIALLVDINIASEMPTVGQGK